MAKVLNALIGAPEPMFSIALRELEMMTGHKGIDIAYLADILQRGHALMRAMGLDPADTTARELHSALIAHLHDDALFHNMADVGLVFGEQVVSLNINDVQVNKDRAFEDRRMTALRGAVTAGLITQYELASQDADRVAQIVAQAGLQKEPPEVAAEVLKQKTKPTKIEIKGEDTMPTILCVGDIISDAFIKLSEDYAEVTTDEKGYQRVSFELGAKLPYDDVEIVEAVECSPNAAVSISRLGLNAQLMSWIGDDAVGEGMIDYLKEQNVNTDAMVVEPGMKSNYHYVLRYGADRTKLQKFEDYSYQWQEPAERPDWLYLGVLGEKTWPLHEAMLNYLEQNPEVKLVFQPGMYHLMWGTEKMAPFYHRAEIVIMNREEAAQVTGVDRGDIKGLIGALHDLGVAVAVVTDGADGAYASRTGEPVLFMANYPDPQPPLDRTGAGDAFASTIAAALALGESLETALKWAPINSMSVVQKMGAQQGLVSREELEGYLANAPEGYEPKELA